MNNKLRESGSGTTSQARRLRREEKQWHSLASTTPPAKDVASLEKHVDALEKAIHSAQQQLALKKAEEAEADRPLKKGKAGPRGKSAKPVLLPADMAAKKEELKDRLESLKKDLGNLSLDAGEADSTLKKDASSSSQPASSSLKKETEKEKLKAFLKEEGTSTQPAPP